MDSKAPEIKTRNDDSMYSNNRTLVLLPIISLTKNSVISQCFTTPLCVVFLRTIQNSGVLAKKLNFLKVKTLEGSGISKNPNVLRNLPVFS